MYEGKRNAYILAGILNAIEHLEDVGVDGRILKETFKKFKNVDWIYMPHDRGR
jgi:hypothetical protein